MKKIVIEMCALAAVMLAACSSKTIDIKALSDKLINEVRFSEKLSEVPLNITEKRYALSDGKVEAGVAYSGTNAVVDELVIFKTSDTDSVKDKVMEHIESQVNIYESYAPDEVSKLNDCVLEVKGDYVILCISEDSDTAEKIIREYTK